MADKSDHRHYPIPPLTETWSKTIEYKSLPNVKYNKCIMLSLDYKKIEENLKKAFGEKYYNEVYRYEYDLKYTRHHINKMAESEFYQEARKKPHFKLNIYKNNLFIETVDLYFSVYKGSSMIRVDNRKIMKSQLVSNPGYKKKRCYSFEENTQYRLEIINDTIVPEFKDVDVFFSIGPIEPKI
ncbi:hypothetical protein A1D29_03515 [Pasteurellaceae bacterium Orientalotternb1]|nr:hypothetical protein A1D29_03515 [Pasteurellaceae bacterium Orientalotternb1]